MSPAAVTTRTAEVLPLAVIAAQTKVKRREFAERMDLLFVLSKVALDDFQCLCSGCMGFRNPVQEVLSSSLIETGADAAWDCPRWVDSLAAKNFNDFLTELTKSDTLACKIRISLRQTDNIAKRRIAVPSKKHVRR
jgi:hypothetical protein